MAILFLPRWQVASINSGKSIQLGLWSVCHESIVNDTKIRYEKRRLDGPSLCHTAQREHTDILIMTLFDDEKIPLYHYVRHFEEPHLTLTAS